MKIVVEADKGWEVYTSRLIGRLIRFVARTGLFSRPKRLVGGPEQGRWEIEW